MPRLPRGVCLWHAIGLDGADLVDGMMNKIIDDLGCFHIPLRA